MAEELIVATERGVAVCTQDGNRWQIVTRGLPEEQVSGVIAREGVILAAGRHGVFRSDDLGQSWRPASAGLSERHVRWLAYHPDQSDFEFAGTEPAGIYVSHDGAESWRARPEVANLRDEHGWFLPYSPGAGCVRGFAFHGTRAYAAVEVGGALVSDDSGETWRLAAGSDGNPAIEDDPPPGLIFPDVHSIAVHPASADLVLAPTGGGFYGSTDGGQTWELRYDCYCRAVWLDPGDPEHLILGPADGVDRGGRIEESQDSGRTWRPAWTGTSAPWPRHMVERFFQVREDLLAVLSNGELWRAPLAGLNWQRGLPEAGHVNAVAWMQD